MHYRIDRRMRPHPEHGSSRLGENDSHDKSDRTSRSGHSHGFYQKLRLNISSPRPNSFPNSNLARSLGNRGKQYVHDPNSADDEYQPGQQAEKEFGEKHSLTGVFESLQ